MKQVISGLIFFITPVLLFAQQPDSVALKIDSFALDTAAIAKIDSARLVVVKDSLLRVKDSTDKKRIATSYTTVIKKLIKDNAYLNASGKPVSMVNKINRHFSADDIFYLVAVILMLLALARFFYTRYFDNLFRVFFNASLRQNQLTDQLLQDKWPSLFFNLVFILAGGVYVYLLLRYYGWIQEGNFWLTILYCTVSMAIVYIAKFLSLKFTGWVTGYREITNTYIFIIFLINKIMGVILLPFVVIIAFSTPVLNTAAVVISLLLISLMFLLRFFRSYGLLEHQLKINRVHFFMYVIGIEIIPLLLIYKGLVVLLSKNTLTLQ